MGCLWSLLFHGSRCVIYIYMLLVILLLVIRVICVCVFSGPINIFSGAADGVLY